MAGSEFQSGGHRDKRVGESAGSLFIRFDSEIQHIFFSETFILNSVFLKKYLWIFQTVTTVGIFDYIYI